MKTKTVIEVQEWDALVEKTYGRKYKLQQQDGCRSRGTLEITVPAEAVALAAALRAARWLGNVPICRGRLMIF